MIIAIILVALLACIALFLARAGKQEYKDRKDGINNVL